MYNIGVLVFNYFVVFLTMIVLFKTYFQLVKLDSIKSKVLLMIIMVCAFLEVLVGNLAPVYVNGIICLSFFIIIEKIFTKGKLGEIIFFNIVIWLILFFLDMLIMVCFNVLNIFIQVDPLIIKPIGTIIMILSLVWITKFNFIIKNIEKVKNYIFNFKIFNIGFMIIIFILYCGLDAYIFIILKDRVVTVVTVILSVITLMAIGKIIFNKIDLINLKKTNQLLIKNNEFYIKLIDDYRIFKHNLTSKLIGIKAISNKDAKKVINDLIKEYNESFKTTFDIKDAPVGINGIIYEKVYNFNCNDLNIKIVNNIEGNILNIISSRSYNLLCEALGIVIDNALEAACKSPEKEIYLQFKENEKDLVVEVMNTFTGEIELEKIGKINYTTKEEGHGLGLYSLLNKRKISLKTNIKNNIFINQIKVIKK